MKYRYREPHEMKDSGVEWLGMIPKKWELKKMNWLFNSIGSGTTPNSGNLEYYENGSISWLLTGDLNDSYLYKTSKKITSLALKEVSSLQIHPIDTLVVAMYGATIGKLGITTFPTTTNQACACFSKPQNTITKYVYYWFLGNRKYIIDMGYGGGQPNISQSLLRGIRISISDILEQQKIADFLDKKCEEFDSVIAKKEMLINKLEEAKKSLISEVVTGKVKVIEKENSEYGIIKREAHEMKDSGVEWLGMIPKEWEDTRCQWILKEISIKGHGNKEVLSLYREYGVIPKNSRDDNHNVTSENTNSYKLVKKDNLVLNKMKVWQGSIGVSKFEGIVSPAYIICEIAKEKVYSKYIHHLLRNKLYIPEYRRLSYGIREGQWDMRFEDFRKIPIFIPNLKKQQKIAEFLDKKCEEFDSTIEKQKESIEKLKSAKQSLISEVVTGKMEIL